MDKLTMVADASNILTVCDVGCGEEMEEIVTVHGYVTRADRMMFRVNQLMQPAYPDTRCHSCFSSDMA